LYPNYFSKLFNEGGGLKNIISTSSIIEGVNTSAKNIIFWGKKNGQSNLNYFGYINSFGIFRDNCTASSAGGLSSKYISPIKCLNIRPPLPIKFL
jgi:hypothetical protein